MANYIEKYESTIDKIMAEHRAKTDPTRLERMAHVNLSNTDLYEQPEDVQKQRIEKAKSKMLMEQGVDTRLDIEAAQNTLKREHQAELNRIERLRLKAATGRVTIADYANANGLLEDVAKAELDDYAKVKTSQFGDSLIDRYAAIRNIGKAEGPDRSKAHAHAEAEADRLNIKDAVKATERGKYYMDMNPAGVMSLWESSGMAIARQLKGQSKE